MATISFAKSRAPIDVPDGSNLMRALLNNGIPVASSCNGDGVCTKCRLKIVAGKENLSKETELEADLRDIHEIPNGERISCQTTVNGPVTVDASYW
ncbi:MAG TPA: 2Fe-2S iron-sulfur cluster-binding protein [Bdellovibrionales bacterium]|nr:2Fe-2S iron-sulfur cluster-binding protein [Bdellovibrionales bacterium]